MVFDEFCFEFNKLGMAFGKNEKQLSAMADVYHDHLTKRMSDDRIRKSFHHLIENAERFPTIKDIVVCSQMFPDTKQRHEATPCNTCWGDGIVRIVYNPGSYRTIWKCPDCDNCSYNYPVWNDEFFMRGYSKVYPDSWDENDEWIIKGLALLGPDSIPWKKAMPECRLAAEKYMNENKNKSKIKSVAGFASAGDALLSKPDPDKEFLRAKIKQKYDPDEKIPF